MTGPSEQSGRYSRPADTTHVAIASAVQSNFRFTVGTAGANDGSTIALGSYGAGPLLTTAGAGTRMIWYPREAAFRVGTVGNTEWDDANIGAYSVALGRSIAAECLRLGTRNGIPLDQRQWHTRPVVRSKPGKLP